MTMKATNDNDDDDEDNDDNGDDNNDDDNDDNDGDEDTDDEEVDFPNQGNLQRRRQMVQSGKQPQNLIAAKNLNLIRALK